MIIIILIKQIIILIKVILLQFMMLSKDIHYNQQYSSLFIQSKMRKKWGRKWRGLRWDKKKKEQPTIFLAEWINIKTYKAPSLKLESLTFTRYCHNNLYIRLIPKASLGEDFLWMCLVDGGGRYRSLGTVWQINPCSSMSNLCLLGLFIGTIFSFEDKGGGNVVGRRVGDINKNGSFSPLWISSLLFIHFWLSILTLSNKLTEYVYPLIATLMLKLLIL